MAVQIHKDMDLEDVAALAPKAIRALSKRKIVCIQCGTPLWKTVEEAIRDAGLEDVDGIVAEVNRELLQG